MCAALVLPEDVKVVCRVVCPEDTVNNSGSIDDDTEIKYVVVIETPSLSVLILGTVDNLTVDVLGMEDVMKYVVGVALDVLIITESDGRYAELVETEVVMRAEALDKTKVVDEADEMAGEAEVERGGVEVVDERGVGGSGRLWLLTVFWGGPF